MAVVTQSEYLRAAAMEACAAEPIHIPGTVQPHGALLALDPVTQRVSHASANLAATLGLAEAFEPLGATLQECLGEPAARRLTGTAVTRRIAAHLPVHEHIEQGGRAFDVLMHRHAGREILEFLPVHGAAGADAVNMEHLQRMLNLMSGDFHDARNWSMAAGLVRDLSGLDRVMIYRFDAEWNGEVIAEARGEDLEPFLGLHYPASDIPQQARRLYEINLARYIPDVLYTPVPLRAQPQAGTPAPLDMSLTDLRGISPVHIEYLRNMGVRATFVLSLMVAGRLWGLIACHHYRTADVSLEQRRLVGIVAHSLAALIGRATARERRDEQGRMNLLHERMLVAAGGAGQREFFDLLGQFEADIRDHTAVAAIALWSGDEVRWWGDPAVAARQESLLPELRRRLLQDRECDTDRFGNEVAAEEVIGGFVAVRFDQIGRTGLAVFRLAQAREVTWAGDPAKRADVADDGLRLSPRRSFAGWREVVRGRSTPWSDATRQFVRDLLLVRERFELRQAQEQLAFIGRAVAHSTEGIMVMDADTAPPGPRVVFINAGFTAMLGYQAAEMAATSARRLLGAASEPDVVRAIEHAFAQGASFQGELVVYRKDGSELPVEIVIDPMLDEAGAVTHFVSLLRDMTERRRLQAHLRERSRALEETVRELEEFDYTIAHDLRAPLRGLIGFATLLRTADADESPAERDHYLERIVGNANFMSRLLDDLLAFARTSRVDLVFETVPVRAVVEECLGVLRQSWPKARFEVGPLPDCTGDASLLKQVWMNLLDNAAKYSYRRDAPLVRVDFDAGFYRVRDNGVGFDQQYVGKVFGIFTRLHSRAEFDGSGIGMAVAKRVIERHGGAIEAEGRVGEGATFRFRV